MPPRLYGVSPQVLAMLDANASGPTVEPAVREETLRSLASRSGQALESLGLILDYPGAIARGVLAGDPLSGFAFDSDSRVSGKELLDAYGLNPGNEALGGWADDIAGFAAEVGTDPLWLLQMGAGVVPKAAKAAQAANILDLAPKAAMAKLGDTTADVLRNAESLRTGKYTIDELTKARVPMTESTLDVRPIVGPRTARFRSTLQDVIDQVDEGRRPEVMRQVRDYLGSDEEVQKQLGERLGNLFGVGPGDTKLAFSPFSDETTEGLLDSLDYLGQVARWNPVTRKAAAFVQGSVGGQSDVAGQIDALKQYKKVDVAGRQVGDAYATIHGQMLRDAVLNDEAKRLLGADTLFSPEGNDLYARLSIGKPTQNDLDIIAQVPQLDAVAQNWDSFAQQALDNAENLGLDLSPLKDRFGNKFTPQYAREMDFAPFGSSGYGQLEASGRFPSQRSRVEQLQFPGGVLDTRQLSLQPKMREHAMRKFDSPFSDQEVGEELYDYILEKHGDPIITLDQANAAADAYRQASEMRDAFGGGQVLAQARGEANAILEAAYRTPYATDEAAARAIARAEQQAADTMRAAEQQSNALATQEGFAAGVYRPQTAEGVNLDQMTAATRSLRPMDKNLPANVPAFSEHPINAQMRYMVETKMREATANHITDSIAEHSKVGVFTQQPGETMRPLKEVVAKYAQPLGFKPAGQGQINEALELQIRRKIAARSGQTPDAVNLDNYYIPQEAADRLVRISDFYSVPKAQEEVGNMFSAFTTLWKSFTLTWPSRYTRDAYSNLASIWLETGDAPGAIAGMNAARHIMAGNAEKAIGYLSKIPRYRTHIRDGVVDSAGLLREFELDVGSNGVLSGLSQSDLLSSNRSGSISQFIPGATPVSVSGGIKKLFPTGERNPLQMIQDFGAIKGVTNTYETRNPLLNAGQEIGDAVDSMARLGGFMALLRTGVGPQQAALRVKSALVDYSSLTPFERHWMKNIFPWWSYQSRIGKYAVTSLYNNPGGRYGQMIRAVNDLQKPEAGEGYIPTALRQQVSVRLPDWLQQNPGTTTFLSNIDLPGLDVINTLIPAPVGQTFPINMQGTMKSLLSQANPLAKFVGEQAFDTDLYSMRPLGEARTAVDKIYAGLAGDRYARVDPLLKGVIQNIPGLNRPLSLAGLVFDPQVENPWYRAAKIAMNEFSGLKFKDVDPEYELLDARNKIGEYLKQYQNTFTQRYIPKEDIPSLPPEALLLNAVDADLQKDLRLFYERKRKARELQAR